MKKRAQRKKAKEHRSRLSKAEKEIKLAQEWFDVSCKPHERTFQHDCRLSSLPTEWERELAALWRLEADVCNGAYLQFLCNWGRDSYVYASQALKKIGAVRTAQIVDQCQALVDKHWSDKPLDQARMPKSLPKKVSQRILDLPREPGYRHSPAASRAENRGR
jgi:hypothetical protein